LLRFSNLEKKMQKLGLMMMMMISIISSVTSQAKAACLRLDMSRFAHNGKNCKICENWKIREVSENRRRGGWEGPNKSCDFCENCENREYCKICEKLENLSSQ